LDSQRRELELEQHRKLTALRDDMEKEMRTQLRRQAGAHADHINDVLEIQSKELQRVHQRSLDESLSVEATNHKRDLARLKGTLDGLDNALDDKSFMASASVETQELWLACVALQKSLKNLENGERISLEDKVIAKNAPQLPRDCSVTAPRLHRDCICNTLNFTTLLGEGCGGCDEKIRGF
jgi:mitofilin